RNAEQLERALHRAVFAMAAVQRDEAARDAIGLQFMQAALCRIERAGIDALRLQRLQHAAARHQRDLALGRRAAHQHRDLAQRLDIHAHGVPLLRSITCPGTLPIVPAPIAMTTSPSRAWSTIACGIAPISSTNTASTLPAI